jgi:hypothetical protein
MLSAATRAKERADGINGGTATLTFTLEPLN